MPEPHVCPHGHHWSEDDISQSAQETLQVCPMCGLPPQTGPDATFAETPNDVVPSPEQTLADGPVVASLPGTLISPVSQQAETIPPIDDPPADLTARPGRAPSLTFRHTYASVPPTSAPEGGPVWRDIPGYAYLGTLGHGGMGVVYKVRDLRLNRVVALKMILTGAHAGAAQRARFLIEAEALASLQHPNIVQVHEVGEHDGCPYLALEFVGGGSLDGRLDDYLRQPRRAADMVQVLARAMHTAHQRGVIHRDLKPANVMLTEYGAPKITDFGLAKRLENESQATQSGAIVGTPSYMAPEQAAGEARTAGPPTDVYALGAILYELLTHRPPFKGGSAMETVQLVLSEEPARPSQFQPGLPRDLETICLKCLQKDPARRYASAEALAEDLRRFLAGEPIEARPVGRLERVWKWARRRPAVAALVAVVVLATASVLALALASNAALRASAAEADRERQRADERSHQARQAVDDMYTEVAQKWLEDRPGQDNVQRELLQKAARLYEVFLGEEGSDPDVRRRTALASYRVARIRHSLRQIDEAERAYRRAIDLQERLCTDFPTDMRYREELAQSFTWWGELLRETGRPFREAEQAYRSARDLQQELVAAAPAMPFYQMELAVSHYNLGTVETDSGRRMEALADFNRAAALLQALRQQDASEPAYRHKLAHVCINRGTLYVAEQQIDLAQADYDQATRLLQELVEQHRSAPIYRYDLGIAALDRGNLLLSQRKYAAAAQAIGSGQALMQKLVDDFPSREGYRKKLAFMHITRGAVRASTRSWVEADHEWRTALALSQQLVQDQPRIPEYRAGLGTAHGNLGWLCRRNAPLPFPPWPLGMTCDTLAGLVPELCLRRQDLGQSREHLEMGITLLKAALEQNPAIQDEREVLRNQHFDLTETLLALGDHAAAARVAAHLALLFPDQGQDCYAAARFLARCAALAARAGQADAAHDYAAQSLAQLRQAVGKGYKDLNRLRADPVWEPLRRQGDGFHALVGAAPRPRAK